MAIDNRKPSIEKHAYQRFMRDFKAKKFGTQRLGQAFYDHFKLHRLTDQGQLNNIYSKDGEHAIACIQAVFNIH